MNVLSYLTGKKNPHEAPSINTQASKSVSVSSSSFKKPTSPSNANPPESIANSLKIRAVLNTDQAAQAALAACRNEIASLPEGSMLLVVIRSLAVWAKTTPISEALLLTAVANLIKATYPNGEGNRCLWDVIAKVMSAIEPRHQAFKKILSDIHQENENSRKEQEQKAIEELFAPLLDMAFPGQTEALEQIIGEWSRSQVWSIIIGYLPALYKSLMGQPAILHEQDASLQQTSGGQALLGCAALIAKQTVKNLRANYAIKPGATPGVTTLAETTADSTIGCLQWMAQGYAAVEWKEAGQTLITMLNQVATQDHQINDKLWNFIESRMTDLLVEAFYHISSQGSHNNDPFTEVMTRLKNFFCIYYVKSAQELKDRYQEIAALEYNDPTRIQWIKKVFGPLAQHFLQFSGLNHSPVIGFNTPAIQNQVPNWLFNLYGVLLNKYPGMHDWIDPATALQKSVDAAATHASAPFSTAAADIAERYLQETLPTQLLQSSNPNQPNTTLADTWADTISRMLCSFEPEKLGPSQAWLQEWICSTLKQAAQTHSATLAQQAVATLKTIFPNQTDENYQAIQSSLRKKIQTWLLNSAEGHYHINGLSEEILKMISAQVPDFDHADTHQKQQWAQTLINKLDSLAKQKSLIEPLWKFIEQHAQGITLDLVARWHIPSSPGGALLGHPLASKVEIALEQIKNFIISHNHHLKARHKAIVKDSQQIAKDKTKIDAMTDEMQKQGRTIVMNARIKHRAELMGHLASELQPLAQRLIKTFGLDKEERFKAFHIDYMLEKQFAALLAQAFSEMHAYQIDHPQTLDKLCEIFFDKALYLHNYQGHDVHIADVSNPDGLSPQQRMNLWTASGAKQKAQYLESYIQAIIAPEVVTFVHPMVAERVQGYLTNQLPLQAIAWLGPEVTQVLNNAHVLSYLESLITMLLPKMLINIAHAVKDAPQPPVISPLSTVSDTPKHHLELFPKKLIEYLGSIIDDHLKEIPGPGPEMRLRLDQRINIALQGDPNTKQDRLRQIFLPLAKDLLNLIGKEPNDASHPLHYIPFLPSEVKGSIWKEVLPNVIADQMIAIYESMHPVVVQPVDALPEEIANLKKADKDESYIKASHETYRAYVKMYLIKHPAVPGEAPVAAEQRMEKAKAEALQHVKYLSTITRVSSKFARDKVKAMMATHDKDYAQALYGKVKKAIHPNPGGHNLPVEAYLQNNQVTGVDLLASNIDKIGKSRVEGIKKLWPLIGDYSTPLLHKTFFGISRQIALNDAQHPQLLLEMSNDILALLDNHAKEVNRVTEMCAQSHPHQVSKHDMFANYGQGPLPWMNLHKGLQAHADMQSQDAKMKYFIRPLTINLLKLAGITQESMQCPPQHQKKLFEMLRDQLLPMVVSNLYEMMISRSSLKNLEAFLSGKIVDLCRKLLPQHQQEATVTTQDSTLPPENNPLIGHLDSALRSLVNWIPSILTNALMDVEAVRALPVNALGTATYHHIEPLSTTDIFGSLLTLGVTSMHPGVWGAAPGGSVEFFPHLVNESGVPQVDIFQEIENIKFQFPETATEQALAAKLAKQHNIEIEQLASAGSKQVINKGIDVIFAEVRKAIWHVIEVVIDFLADHLCSCCAAGVKKVVKAFLSIIGKILGWVFFPIYLILIMPPKMLYAAYQARTIEKNLSLAIHENFLMHALERFIQRELQASGIQPYVEQG